MCKIIYSFTIVLYLLTECVLTKHVLTEPVTDLTSEDRCYSEYCQNLDSLSRTEGFQCMLTRIQKGEDCAKLKFEDFNEKTFKQDTTRFILRAYITNLQKFSSFLERTTAFNLSISDINFHKLVTRYQNVDATENSCRHIELYGNSTHPAPKNLYLACPFSSNEYEGSLYRLEYYVTGENYRYSRKYIFYVPYHIYIEENVEVEKFTPFIYIDVTDPINLVLYIQPLPESYKITEYKVYLIHNDTESVINVRIPAEKNREHIQYNFTASGGIYYVKVQALDPKCGEHGCANSTSPYIHIKHVSDRLLIMIISIMWIPPVILYTLYYSFKLYKKRVLQKMARKPNCLLVYSPTHSAHVNVMAELTKYLRCFNINAMIDMFDIAETTSKDPGLWCNTAFQIADVVLVVTSPPSIKSDSTTVYRNIDNHLLRLLKENYPQRNKRYYTIHLPYCKPDDIPEEAQLFKKFRIPEDLSKLINTIHDISYLGFTAISDNKLSSSIKFATIKIFQEDTSTMKNKETDDLLPFTIVQGITNHDADQSINIHRPDTPNGSIIPQSFTTNIDELNLLDENSEVKVFTPNFAKKDCKFRIDDLNL